MVVLTMCTLACPVRQKKTHAFFEDPAALRHTSYSQPNTPGRPHDSRSHTAAGNSERVGNGDGDWSPSKLAGVARAERRKVGGSAKKGEDEGNKPLWRDVGPYSSPNPKNRK